MEIIMLTLENIGLTFGNQRTGPIFSDLNFTVDAGAFIMILGGNGAGKTSLFNIISGAQQPDTGRVFLCGEDITALSQEKRARLVAMVSQDPKSGTMASMTLEENLSLAFNRGERRGFQRALIPGRRAFFQDKLSMLGMGLEDQLTVLAGALSGGQRQALSLIMALLVPSKILLLDEITAALDPQMAKTVMDIALRVVTIEKRTTLMITHNMSHALAYGDRTVILEKGHLTRFFSKQDRQSMTALDFAQILGEA